MLTDSQLFTQYGPRCSGQSAVVRLHGRGAVTVKPTIVEAVKALNSVLIAFAYATRAADTGAFNCRKKVSGNGWSIHALKIALDINWTTNPYGPRLVTDYPPSMVRAIRVIRTNSGAVVWSWGGDWSGNKDAMHWQIACTVRDLATGIDWRTVLASTAAAPSPGQPAPTVTTPAPSVPPAPERPEEDEMAKYFQVTNDQVLPTDVPKGAIVRVTESVWAHLTVDDWTVERELLGFTPTLVPIDQPKMRSMQRTRLNANAF